MKGYFVALFLSGAILSFFPFRKDLYQEQVITHATGLVICFVGLALLIADLLRR